MQSKNQNKNTEKNIEKKHIHIVGICGVATSAIAIAFKDKGWKVTGSDKGFFPPVSTELEKNKIEFYPGWHPEKVGKPDIIMTGGVGTSPNNPEVVHAKENTIPIYSYAEILEKYFIKDKSIVITGTWGKTTISSMISFIMIEAGLHPSYFTGGISLSHKTGEMSDSKWSVVEGDEYQVSISDKRPKFIYYNPTHLLLTSVSWDHADLYPTEKSYFKVFEDLVEKVKIIVACNDNKGVKDILKNKKYIKYGMTDESDYFYTDIIHSRNGLDFVIKNKDNVWKIHSPMLGKYNVENITGAFAMTHTIGIKPEIIIKAINNFIGIKRRLERRYVGNIDILDCHAPTGEKASYVLESLREVYSGKIIAIFEPNIGGRQRESIEKYDNAFENADIVIIPKLTKLKIAENEENRPMEGDELAKVISMTHNNVKYIDDDTKLVETVKNQSETGDIIVFLGSHGFRGMIEETIEKISS